MINHSNRCISVLICGNGFAAIGENRQSNTDEPIEFKKQAVEVQDCMKITDHFRGIYRLYPNLMKENPKDVNM